MKKWADKEQMESSLDININTITQPPVNPRVHIDLTRSPSATGQGRGDVLIMEEVDCRMVRERDSYTRPSRAPSGVTSASYSPSRYHGSPSISTVRYSSASESEGRAYYTPQSRSDLPMVQWTPPSGMVSPRSVEMRVAWGDSPARFDRG